jgi:hypothetical protein
MKTLARKSPQLPKKVLTYYLLTYVPSRPASALFRLAIVVALWCFDIRYSSGAPGHRGEDFHQQSSQHSSEATAASAVCATQTSLSQLAQLEEVRVTMDIWACANKDR